MSIGKLKTEKIKYCEGIDLYKHKAVWSFDYQLLFLMILWIGAQHSDMILLLIFLEVSQELMGLEHSR